MTLMRVGLVAALLLAAAPALADDANPAKAHDLSPAVERAWISAVQNFKMADGTTVLQTLRYAERLRPGKFEVGSFGAGYNGASGEPEDIAVDYWIGAKREADDAISMLFAVRTHDGKIVVEDPKTPDGGTAAEAVVSGRDGLLRFIDEQYREDCIDANSGETLC